MSKERNNSRNKSTSPNINDNQPSNSNTNDSLNIGQRVYPASATSSSTKYPLGISFLSTSTPINESEDMAYIEKRTAHNALERQRREGLNSKFQELAHVLPALQQIRRPSKNMIVAKSLEFVSSAVERETEFQGQLQALRVENAQLQRQARLSTKRMRKQVEYDAVSVAASTSSHSSISSSLSSKQLGKQPTSATLVPKSPPENSSDTKSASSVIKSKKRRQQVPVNTAVMSKMKPQLRQSSSPISTADQQPISATTASPSSSTLNRPRKIKKRSPSLGIDTSFSNNDDASNTTSYQKKKRSKEGINDDQPISITAKAGVDTYTSKRRKRNSTTDLVATSSSINNSTVLNTSFMYTRQQQHIQHLNQQYQRHNRNNSHQPSSSSNTAAGLVVNETISPVVSRHSSISAVPNAIPNHCHQMSSLLFNNNQVDSSVFVPSQHHQQFAPFGGSEQHTFSFNTYDNNFEDVVVSTVPAVRTPVGSSRSDNNNSSSNNINQQAHDPTTNLDIFNSLMQDPNPSPNNNPPNYFW